MAIATVAYAQPPAIIRREQDRVQGHEGRQIEQRLKQIYEDLRLSQPWNKLLPVNSELEETTNLEVAALAYGPPKRTYTWRVRYHYVGRGEPLHYTTDDETVVK